jgi:hypothetical protein
MSSHKKITLRKIIILDFKKVIGFNKLINNFANEFRGKI